MNLETRSIRASVASLLFALVVAACSAGAPSSSPSGSGEPSAPPSGQPSASQAPLPSGFYLRAWQTQALEPHNTFTWLPLTTISDGVLIDGMIAVPAIYPGPLYVSPVQRSISEKGIATVVDEARKDGLLTDKTNFFATPGAAGAIVGHLEIVIDGKRYELTGDTTSNLRCRCIPDPGSPGAFAAFWERLTSLSQWIPAELGGESPYVPDRLGLLVFDPKTPDGGIKPNDVAWPLAAGFGTFGTPLGTDRCAVVSGGDLEKLLPIVSHGNQLTRFTDAQGTTKSLVVRALVPGEPTPCQA